MKKKKEKGRRKAQKNILKNSKVAHWLGWWGNYQNKRSKYGEGEGGNKHES